MQSTDDELHCIRYSLLVPALAAAYVVARGALSLHALDVHCTLQNWHRTWVYLNKQESFRAWRTLFVYSDEPRLYKGSLVALW